MSEKIDAQAMEVQEIASLSLDEQVKYWDRQTLEGVRQTVEGAWNCGRVLIAKKGELDHGEWLPWLETVDFERRRASTYMQIADAYPNGTPGSHLPGGIRGVLRALTASRAVEAGPQPVDTSEADAEPKPLTTAEKKLVELDQAKGEALEAKREVVETREELKTERKITAALETEVRTLGGKPQVRAEVVGLRQEILQLKNKIREGESEVADMRRVVAWYKKELKKLKAAWQPHVAHDSGENEWYTPEPIIEAARAVMGDIDLDPASCAEANETVKAKTFYSLPGDGLKEVWYGRVWLNPPYAAKLIDAFIEKLCASSIEKAILIVNNATETRWGASLLSIGNCFCFPTGRVRFVGPDGKEGAPLQGQIIVGVDVVPSRFTEHFAPFGPILLRTAGPPHGTD